MFETTFESILPRVASLRGSVRQSEAKEEGSHCCKRRTNASNPCCLEHSVEQDPLRRNGNHSKFRGFHSDFVTSSLPGLLNQSQTAYVR